MNTKNQLTTTLEITKQSGLPHKEILKMVKKYKKRMNGFSDSKIKVQLLKNKKCRCREYFSLNEGQEGLLVLLMRNTEKTVELKSRLVKEIYQIAKENIISFSEIIGKSKIPAIKQLT